MLYRLHSSRHGKMKSLSDCRRNSGWLQEHYRLNTAAVEKISYHRNTQIPALQQHTMLVSDRDDSLLRVG